VYDPEAEPETNLLDELGCRPADDVLIALRKSFSLTYPRNPFIDGIQAAITEIRRICVEALKPMSAILADLGLPPIPPYTNDPTLDKAQVFQFVFARTKDIDIAVKVNGRRKRLLDVIGHGDATPLLVTIRSIISETFTEAHDEDQHMEILERIRQTIWHVLPEFNVCLESIEIEPIAEQDSDSDGEIESDGATG
jgi:hypothetical protein